MSRNAGKPEKILVVTYWSYNDALVQTYVLPYLRIIRSLRPDVPVFLVTFNKNAPGSNAANLQPAEIEPGIQHIPFSYTAFGTTAILKMGGAFTRLLSIIRKEKITHIHSWCTPAGAIGVLLKKLTGRKLIIDSFEPHAQPMEEGGTWQKNSLAYRLLMKLEKAQLKAADEVICTVPSMAAYSQKTYGIVKNRYFAKPACVDLERFDPATAQPPEDLKKALEGKIVCVYAGKFGGLYLERETFDFIKVAEEKWGDRFRFLLLSGHSEKEIDDYCSLSGADRNKIVHRFVPSAAVANYLALADFGICPMKPLPSRRYSTPIKNGEYWAMGLPVVITRNISDDSDIIAANNAGYVLQDLTQNEYGNAVDQIDALLEEDKGSLKNRIRALAVRYRNFSIAVDVYSEIYRRKDTLKT